MFKLTVRVRKDVVNRIIEHVQIGVFSIACTVNMTEPVVSVSMVHRGYVVRGRKANYLARTPLFSPKIGELFLVRRKRRRMLAGSYCKRCGKLARSAIWSALTALTRAESVLTGPFSLRVERLFRSRNRSVESLDVGADVFSISARVLVWA